MVNRPATMFTCVPLKHLGGVGVGGVIVDICMLLSGYQLHVAHTEHFFRD